MIWIPPPACPTKILTIVTNIGNPLARVTVIELWVCVGPGRAVIHIVKVVVRQLLRGFHAPPARRLEADHSKHRATTACQAGQWITHPR